MIKLHYPLWSLLVILLITGTQPVYASDLQNNLHGYQSELSTLKQQATSQTQHISATIQQAQSLQTSVSLLHLVRFQIPVTLAVSPVKCLVPAASLILIISPVFHLQAVSPAA